MKYGVCYKPVFFASPSYILETCKKNQDKLWQKLDCESLLFDSADGGLLMFHLKENREVVVHTYGRRIQSNNKKEQTMDICYNRDDFFIISKRNQTQKNIYCLYAFI